MLGSFVTMLKTAGDGPHWAHCALTPKKKCAALEPAVVTFSGVGS